MKKLVLMAFAMCTFASASAHAATVDQVLNQSTCATTLTSDSGTTMKLGTSVDDTCACTTAGTGCASTKVVNWGTSCGTGWGFGGQTITGKKCCTASCFNSAEEEAAHYEKIASTMSEEELAEVFQPTFATQHWGVIDNINKSPSSGRTVANEAKLDACLGHGNVDSIKSLAAFQQLSTCRGGSYCGSSHNGACTRTEANGETLCQDRCDCVFGGSCNGY